MNRKKIFSLFAGLGCLLLAIVSISDTAQAKNDPVPLTEKIKKVPPQEAIYKKDIKPLTMEQCSQCHIGVFRLLKADGARHQKQCVFCHEEYHTYAPGKVEYKESLPLCQSCHGQPHGSGPEVTACSNCHSNAHSPLILPDIKDDKCEKCHAGPPKELRDNQTLHTDVVCSDCHTTHGHIPSCYDCHSEAAGYPYHLMGVEQSTCLGCHPVHRPLELQYAEDTPQSQCAPCHKNPSHEKVLGIVRNSNSKHNTDVTCAGCHDEHAKIPSCFMCHDDSGHRDGLKDPDCLRCHVNPHEPVNIVFSVEEPQKSCTGCHDPAYDLLIKSNTRHTKLTCTKCHPNHREIPPCQRCHGEPHSKAIHSQGNCGSCHGIGHDIQGRMK